jgi:Amt family ammonium transporter
MLVRKLLGPGIGILVAAAVVAAGLAMFVPTGSKAFADCDPAAQTCPDRSGLTTGSGSNLVDLAPGTITQEDVDKAERSEPFALKLADWVNQNRLGINFTWVLITGYLVMFMQAGFALVETGFARAKNAAHTMAMNFMVYPLGMLGFYICGFAFMFGGIGNVGVANLGGLANLNQELTVHIGGVDWGLIGHKGFFLGGQTYDVGIAVLFLFQMVFMDTTATIPTGAMCERWKWTAFLAYCPIISMLIYPIFGNWVWGGGWLSQLGAKGLGSGYLDFAGSGVVHAVGGWTALAGAIVLGPRIGKYNKDGSSNAIPGHNLVLALLGTFILAFGWFGFNPGSSLGASGAGNLRIGVVAVNTMLASATGALAAMVYMWTTTKKPDPGMMANGMLAGLVAITAPSGFVSPIGACAIGIIAGGLVCIAAAFVDRVLHVDDPVGAIAVHGFNGMWGQIALGIFADGSANFGGVSAKGLLFGDAGQFGAQLIGAGVAFVWAFGVAYIFFKVYHAVFGMRVSAEYELAGLDIPEMGTIAYPLDAEPHRGEGGLGLPVPGMVGATAAGAAGAG